MVEAEEYLFYLKNALRKNRMHGYEIGRKTNGKICLFHENGRWIVSRILAGVSVDPKEYEPSEIWLACEDITARLSKNETQRKRIWMEWASEANWAEKMDDPIVCDRVDKPNDTETNVTSR